MPPQRPIKLPRDILSESEIADRADALRRRLAPDDRLPVPIEAMLEFGLGISVVLQFGLEGAGGDEVDGYLTPDLQEVRIDWHTYDYVKARARFTMAHECGHAVLHPRVYTDVAQTLTLGQYRELMANLDEKELGWIEFQANCFAGHLLVPRDHLRREFEKTRKGLGIDIPVGPGDLEAIIVELQPIFEVSAAVLRIRCTKDGLAAPESR
jgi:hypothetical protein